MYLISLPLLDLTGRFTSNYNERFDMIRKSLLFQSCKKNTILGYTFLLVELVWTSVFIACCYAASIKTMKLYFAFLSVSLTFYSYVAMSCCLYFFFDDEDYRRRMRAAEVLNEETIERMESILRNEESENSHEISVPTNPTIRRCTTVENT